MSTGYTRPETAHRFFAAAAFALIAVAGPLAARQAGDQPAPGVPDEPPAPTTPLPAPPPAETGAPDPLLVDFTARSIVRAALADLRVNPLPTEDDYRIALILLSLAQDLAPEDQEILRRRIQAAWACNDEAAVLELTRRLLELDPTDTVAQLRLISARIGLLQSVDDRLKAYDRLLGKAAEKVLDASIRSRLAIDAALLARERGDEEGFSRYLTLATQLDPTHKEAASLAAQYYNDSVGGEVGRLELLSNLLYADPVDFNIHLTICKELASGSAFKGASRFQLNAITILQAAGEVPPALALENLVMGWHLNGPKALMEALSQRILAERDNVRRNIDRYKAANRPVEDLPKPEDVQLSTPYFRLYIAAADATGDRTAVESAVLQFKVATESQIQKLRDPRQRPKDMTDEQVEQMISVLYEELQSARLMVGVQVDTARAELVQNLPLNKTVLDRAPELEGWLRLRLGDVTGAVAWLEPLSKFNPGARLGLAVAYEQLGKTEEAIAGYRSVFNEFPLSASGAWARAKMQALGAVDDAPRIQALERFAAGVPSWLDKMIMDSHSAFIFSIEPTRPVIEALDRDELKISIQNISPIPLALGSDRAINSRVLITPSLETAIGIPLGVISPEVIELDRRLRLMPRERIEVTVWANPALTGWIMELLSEQTTRVRWRATQGFLMGQDGSFRPGVMCATAETIPVERRALVESRLPPHELAQKISGDPERALMRTVAALRTGLMPLDGGLPPQQQQGQQTPQGQRPQGKPPMDLRPWVLPAQAAATRYPLLSPLARAMMLAVLPHRNLSPVMIYFDDATHRETEPLPLALALITRVTHPEDPLIARAESSSDPRVKQLAGLVKGRLGKRPCLSYMTPEVLRPKLKQGQQQGRPQGQPQGQPGAAPPGQQPPPQIPSQPVPAGR